jgi:hypothetical protein
LWGVLIDGPQPGIDLDFVMATRSYRWQDADARAKVDAAVTAQKERDRVGGSQGGAARGAVAFHSVEAGHWVHVDNPTGLAAIMKPYFARPSR